MAPLFLRVHKRDNVAIVVDPEGVSPGGCDANGVCAHELIPQSHKIALANFAPGEPVIRYGETIGHANRAITAGSWVREEFIDLPSAPPLDELPLATAVPKPLPHLEGYTFQGFRNAD